VGYAGQVFNGNLAASEDEWKKLFASYGIEFVVLPPEACYDLSEIDVLIGIRSFSKFPYDTKPASKLVNAWHAGIPFIGGFDSAFEQMGKPGKDYIQVSSIEEVQDAVLKLKNDPPFYQSIIEEGNAKAKRYNDDVTFNRWEEVLTGPIADRYSEWQKRKLIERQRFLLLANINKVQSAAKMFAKRIAGTEAIQNLKRKLYRG
jgi:hypothetical protein